MMFTHISEKEFAAVYNQQYNRSNIRKFLYRRGNHWAVKLERIFDLLSKIQVQGKQVLDLGCSVGTLAVEFAQRGWQATGVDLDAQAIVVARQMASYLNLKVDYQVGDISQPQIFPEKSFDLIVAGDIIEHLPDAVLDSTIANVRRWLKPGGYFLYHTVPTRGDYVFHKSLLWIGLIPAAILPDRYFDRAARVYDRLVRSIPWLVREDPASTTIHCNLQEVSVLRRRLDSAGFEVLSLDASIFEPRFKRNWLKQFLFGTKTAYQKNLSGVAWRPLEWSTPAAAQASQTPAAHVAST